LLIYYLEDDSLNIYCEAPRNSGTVSGSYLKRGNYENELPSDSILPRPFIPQDIYLGNIIALNGMEFRIIEMDSMSLRFCESYPDEFPLFDTFSVMRRVLDQMILNHIDIRYILQKTENMNPLTGLITKETFFRELDHLNICGDLKDQEIMTLLRRFEDNRLYHYDELCDFLSHLFVITHHINQSTTNGSELFFYNMRRKQTQWRRVFRIDRTSSNGYISLDRLNKQVKRQQSKLSTNDRHFLRNEYGVPAGTPGTEYVILPEKGDGLKKIKMKFTTGNKFLQALANTGTATRGTQDSKPEDGSTMSMDMSVTGTSIAGTVDTSGGLPVSPIAIRRETLTQSLFPRKVVVDDKLLSRVKMEYDEKATIINYTKLCDDMYRCDWL